MRGWAITSLNFKIGNQNRNFRENCTDYLIPMLMIAIIQENNTNSFCSVGQK